MQFFDFAVIQEVSINSLPLCLACLCFVLNR